MRTGSRIPPFEKAETADYVVFKDGNVIKAKDGDTGEIEFSGTDSSTIINDVIDALPTGSIFIKEGVYTLTSTIVFENKTDITLRGSGWGTKLKVASDSPKMNMIRIGHRTDAGKACQRIVITDLYLDGTNQDEVSVSPEDEEKCLGIDFESPDHETRNCRVKGCYVYNTGNDGIYGYKTKNMVIEKNFVDSVRAFWAGIHQHEGHDWLVANNFVQNCEVSAIRHGSPIIGNHIENCGKVNDDFVIVGLYGPIVGNYLYDVGRGIDTFRDDQIVKGNKIDTTQGTGIQVYKDSNCVVVGNHLLNVGGASIIARKYSHRCVIANNVVLSGEGFGIQVGRSNGSVVKGNIVEDCGKSGIRVYEGEAKTYTDIIVSGNRVTGCDGDGVVFEEIAGGTLDYYLISNNILRGNTGTNLNDSASGEHAKIMGNTPPADLSEIRQNKRFLDNKELQLGSDRDHYIYFDGGSTHWSGSRPVYCDYNHNWIWQLGGFVWFKTYARFEDDTSIRFGDDEDYHLQYDSANDWLEIVDRINGVDLKRFLKNGGEQIPSGSAYDSAPAHALGKIVLASPTWDPDGDGNGELVMSDGTAWNEVVDLPNYT